MKSSNNYRIKNKTLRLLLTVALMTCAVFLVSGISAFAGTNGDEVYIFDQAVCKYQSNNNTYTTYWLTKETTVKSNTYTTLTSDGADADNYNVKFEYSDDGKLYTITLKNINTDHPYVGTMSGNSFIKIGSTVKTKIVLEGANTITSDSNQAKYAIYVNKEKSKGVEIAGSGSLTTTCYTAAVSVFNATGDFIVSGGTCNFNVDSSDSSITEGIRCCNYKQTAGKVTLNVVGKSGSDPCGISSGITSGYTGKFDVSGGTLDITVQSTQNNKVGGVIGFTDATIGDANVTIKINNSSTERKKLFGTSMNVGGIWSGGVIYTQDSMKISLTNDWSHGKAFDGSDAVAKESDDANAIALLKTYAVEEKDKNTYRYFSTKGSIKTTITLDAQGGTGGTTEVAATKDAAMPTATMPTKTGYTFKGYYDAATAGTQYYDKDGASAKNWDKEDATFTLYAQYDAKQTTVTFDKKDGTGGTDSVTATYDAAMPTATMPTRTGYTFKGYYDAATDGTQYYDKDGASAKNWDKTDAAVTLYAQWEIKTTTVTLDAQSGTGGTASVTATYGSAMPTALMPSKTGHNFLGYYDAVSGGTQYYTSTGASAKNWDKEDATYTLYAQWTAKQTTVTFDKKDGTGGTDSVTATYDAAMPTATMPTRTGYTFKGYYDAATDGTQYYDKDGASAKNWDKEDETVTLYAQWEIKTTTVTLDAQSGTGGTASVTATYGSAMPTATMPSKTGHNFLGYYDAVSGGTQYYTSTGASAKNWDKEDATFTLYAQWDGTADTSNEEKVVPEVACTLPAEKKTDIENAVKNDTKASGVLDALKEGELDDIMTAAGITSADLENGGNEIKTEIEISVKITEYSESESGSKISFEVKPTANVYLNGIKKNTSPIAITNDQLDGSSITITLPTCGIEPEEVIHTSSTDGTQEVFHKTGAKTFSYDSTKQTVTITITNFSLIDINSTPTKREVTFNPNGGTGTMPMVYADNNKEYTLPACGFTAPSGKVFDGWLVGSDKKAAGEKVTITADIEIKAQWKDAPAPAPGPTPTPAPDEKDDPEPTPVEKVDSFLIAKAEAAGKTALKVSWLECKGASEYEIYASMCNTKGKEYKVKKIAKTSNLTYTIKKINKKSLKKNTFYKVKLVALDANGKQIAEANIMHAATGGFRSKYGNAVKITPKATNVEAVIGETVNVGVKSIKYYKGKKAPANHGNKVRYLSDDSEIATVDSKGVVTAVKAGTCKIYMQAVNGLWTSTEVKVNSKVDLGVCYNGKALPYFKNIVVPYTTWSDAAAQNWKFTVKTDSEEIKGILATMDRAILEENGEYVALLSTVKELSVTFAVKRDSNKSVYLIIDSFEAKLADNTVTTQNELVIPETKLMLMNGVNTALKDGVENGHQYLITKIK